MDKDAFCRKVGQLCAAQYGVDDGGSLCYNLIDMGVVCMADGEDVAARIVAQHILQA